MQRNPFMINEQLPFQKGGKGISPDTQRLIALACALGRYNSENLLFNYKYFTIPGIRKQVQTRQLTGKRKRRKHSSAAFIRLKEYFISLSSPFLLLRL